MGDIKLGRIVKIEGLSLLVQVTEDVSDRLRIYKEHSGFLVSINRLIYVKLPCGKWVIAKIIKIYDKNAYEHEEVFTPSKAKYFFEAVLVGIYDDYLKTFDVGVNNFPIIGSEVFALNLNIYNRVMDIGSKYRLLLGESYHKSEIKVFANPDILLGKHLAVLGNTGTGKTCTVASIIQGLKLRLEGLEGNVSPKVLIFDSNKEYERAFPKDRYKVKVVPKENIKLPHYKLDIYEFYKLLDASQGVQAPVLKEAIFALKGTSDSFSFSDLPDKIEAIIKEKSGYDENDPEKKKKNAFSYNQWMGWVSTLLNRIRMLNDDERFKCVMQADTSDLEDLLQGDDEIIIFDTDFSRDVLDVVMFLYCKIIYQWAHTQKERKNVLLVFEEAHRYINEGDTSDYKLGNYYIERLAREGRKFGVSLIISSQRPSELSKTVLSQCNSHVIHKITNRADLEFVRRLLSIETGGLLDIIPGLEQQYAVVTGEAFGFSDIIKIAQAVPTPKSEDPKVIDSWK